MICRSALLILAGLSLVGTSTMVTAAAQPGVAIFVDEELGVTGARPLGWAEYPPRVYRRAPGTSDLTTFVQRRCARGVSPDEALTAIPTYGALPKPSGCCPTDWCVWNLYRAESHVWGVGRVIIEIALTEIEGTIYVTALQAPADDYAALREAVLQPALTTMMPSRPTDPLRIEEPEDAAYPQPVPLAAR